MFSRHIDGEAKPTEGEKQRVLIAQGEHHPRVHAVGYRKAVGVAAPHDLRMVCIRDIGYHVGKCFADNEKHIVIVLRGDDHLGVRLLDIQR